MDAATRELFEEIAHIRGMVPSDSANARTLATTVEESEG